MTNEQAITVLNMIEAHGDLAIKAKELAIEALRKQIPRKYVFKDGYWVCANCEETIVNDYYYCPNCGQAHDWSDDIGRETT